MTFLPPSAKLTNPTHKVVGPDGTEYFLIALRGRTLRIRILFDAPNWADTTPAGSISTGWGPTAADDVMMGRWIGPLRHHFTQGALDLLPDGTHCVEVNPAVSSLDYKTDVIWRGWGERGVNTVALRRASANTYAGSLPVTRLEVDKARAAVEAHRAALLDGTYRRMDGPMVLNTAPETGGYRPTYVQAEGSPVPADLLGEFVADADLMLSYLDFLDSIPPLPERPRERPATAQELANAREKLRIGYFKRERERAYYERLVVTQRWSAPDTRDAFTYPGQVMCV